MSRLRVLLLVAFATVMAVPRSSSAKCQPSCLELLCSAPSTIISGELQPDPADPTRQVLVIGTVLQSAPGQMLPKHGDRLSIRSDTTLTSGFVVAYYHGTDLSMPLDIFPVGADGNVHCRDLAESSSAPEGMGVTPPRLAQLSGLPDIRECHAQLKKAGYEAPLPCDDTPGCGLAGRPREAAPASLLTATLLLMLAAAKVRR